MIGIRPSGALAVLLAAACSAEPSPEQLRSTLTQHPEILYAAIRAHPQEFVTLLDSVARATSGARQASSEQAEERRIEAEIAHPRQPDLSQGVYFGNPSAPITIVEYTDFECPYCRQEHPVIVELFKRYGDRMRLVVKDMPMPFHPRAMPAARMFEAVAMQDPSKAPKFYDVMYEHQERLVAEGDRGAICTLSGASRGICTLSGASRAIRTSAARTVPTVTRAAGHHAGGSRRRRKPSPSRLRIRRTTSRPADPAPPRPARPARSRTRPSCDAASVRSAGS